ncbi:MAG: gliding motility-associated C-terminal domain-containing protein [Bacteroidetes bacterium]|nr:gliding motility-associated C-terminal domain-containing protein [Bacteroidota bacterium]
MRRIFIFLFILTALHSTAQFNVTVTPSDIMVCFGGTAQFTATIQDTASSTYSYNWLFKGSYISGIDTLNSYLAFLNISELDTGYYQCIARDINNPAKLAISDSVHLGMHGQLHIDTLYRFNPLACPRPDPCKGQMKVLVSGGNPPYTYEWGSGHSQDTIGYNLCKGTHLLTVTDTLNAHCISREYTIDVLKLPPIAFTKSPKDTVYLSNPFLTVAFPDTSEKNLTNWSWDFDDKSPVVPNVNPYQHAYSATGRYYVKLNFTDLNGCDSTITDTIDVRLIRLFIPNVITPGRGDDNSALNIRASDTTGTKPVGQNLDLSEIFLSNEMVIFNRQGRRVYERANYNSGDWDGNNLAEGVYYYIFSVHGENGDEVYRGSITILR